MRMSPLVRTATSFRARRTSQIVAAAALTALALGCVKAQSAESEVPAPAQSPAVQTAPPTAPAPADAADAPPAGSGEKTVAPSALAALVGNTISSKGDENGTLIIYLGADGSAKMLDQDELLTGQWLNRGDTLCMRFPNDDGESCYAAAVSGKIAILTDEDGDKRRFDILSGNPNKF